MDGAAIVAQRVFGTPLNAFGCKKRIQRIALWRLWNGCTRFFNADSNKAAVQCHLQLFQLRVIQVGKHLLKDALLQSLDHANSPFVRGLATAAIPSCVLAAGGLVGRVGNDNLQQQAAAIFRSWFVDCAPFGGKAPDEWENAILENITALVSRGITPKYADDTDQIVINQKCIRNHTIDLSLARTHTPRVINEKWLRFGDLLINSTGDGTLGRAAQVWFQPKNLTVDSHVTIVRPAKENLIFYIGLWGILHEKEIESLHTGSTGQTELPRDRVKAMELLLPDNETLDRFNALITPMAATIVTNQEENNRLAALRDAILPKLMSGEIDVSAVQL